jgi:hypothetical protein
MNYLTASARMLLASSALAAAAPALAQETGDAPPPTPTLPAAAEGAKSYTPADFARFSPKTAADMLRQVPGFVIEEQEDRRGLGQASANVLINGQRFSGKSNDVVTELGRISAANVSRIDIVDGATLDVPGLSGQVANIITASTGMSGSFAWRPQIRAKRTPPRLTNGEISVSGNAGRFGYTLSAENQSQRNGNAGLERVFQPDGTLLDLRPEVLSVDIEQPKLSGSLKYQGPNGEIGNLNGSVQIFHSDVQEISVRRPFGGVGRDRRVREREREWNYEIGGDFEFGLGDGRLKLIGLRRFEHSPFTQTLTEDFLDGRPQTGDRFQQVADETETIARAEYRWKSGGADWQVSAEGAFNVLDAANGLFKLDEEGVFQPVPLPNSVSTVDEKRGELMLSYGRPLSPALTLQSAVGVEYSQLSQSGDAGLTRTFVRPKGFVSLAWKASPRLDISGKIEREVGQLNFFDFVASANVSGGTTNAGNVNLVPQQSWNAEVEATRNLGAYGTTTARAYGRLISDIVDVVPIGDTGQAPGNLDQATVFGVEWTSTFTFDPFGWKGAKLDLELQAQKTELTDPVTGVKRAINENLKHRVLANFRHDVPGTDWAYGASYERYVQSPGFRLDQRFRFDNRPGNLGIYVEHKDVVGLTVRGSVDNLLGTNESFTRSFYDGRRTGDLLFTESRDRYYGTVFTLAISGKL